MTLKDQFCAALKAALEGRHADIPEEAAGLWQCFRELAKARSYHGGGPNPISFSDIDAYIRVMRVPMEPQHIEIILAMDGVWLDHAYGPKAAPEGVKTLPPVSKAPISADLLDAMFG